LSSKGQALWLEFSPSLNLNKIEHFSKVSVLQLKPGEIPIRIFP